MEVYFESTRSNMQQLDPTTPILETQQKIIVDNLMEYHAELQPMGRRICCFERSIPGDVDTEDVLMINYKAITLLDQNEDNLVLDKGCIFANKGMTKEGENVLTIGLEGKYIQKDGTEKMGLIYIRQEEDKPCRQFKMFRKDNISGHFVKEEIPVDETSYDFFRLLMHVLGEHRHPLTMESELKRDLLKARIVDLESRVSRATETMYDYNDEYRLEVIKNRFGELIVDLVNKATEEYEYRFRRFKNTYIFNYGESLMCEGKDRTIPNKMEDRLLNIFSQMIATALDFQLI